VRSWYRRLIQDTEATNDRSQISRGFIPQDTIYFGVGDYDIRGKVNDDKYEYILELMIGTKSKYVYDSVPN